MKKTSNISLIIPSYNTEKHLINTYNSVRKYYKNVEMVIINDGSEDNTSEWLNNLNDKNVIKINSKERKGHTFFYDEGMKHATNEIVGILHSDMVIGPYYIENMLKHLEKGKVVCATRIEPPIHPEGKEKIIKDFGMDFDDLKLNEFHEFCIKEQNNNNNKTTKGIFAPWIIYKEDHFAIGGHDQTFAPYGYEDSDIFNRWILAGYEMVQSRDSLVYHLTCRGHRWNKGVGIENDDYKSTMNRCSRDFIRKWGDWINNDEYQYPIINPKYDIGIILPQNNLQFLNDLEPWGSTIYTNPHIIQDYIQVEQPNTNFNLNNRLKSINEEKQNQILIYIHEYKFVEEDFINITKLPAILSNDSELSKEKLPCDFNLGNLKITIKGLDTYENNLIICQK